MTELIIHEDRDLLASEASLFDPTTEIPPLCETVAELETWMRQAMASNKATMASVRNATVVMNRLLDIMVSDPFFRMVDHGHAGDANFALQGLLMLIETEQERRQSLAEFRNRQSVILTTAIRKPSERLLS